MTFPTPRTAKVEFKIKNAATVLLACATITATAADWPQAGYDAAGSGKSPEVLPADLQPLWERQLPPLAPAWRQDHLFAGPRHQVDSFYSPIVLGQTMFVPSMVNDSVIALDTESGAVRWQYYCDGPVRFAPVGFDGKVCFGSDDGHLYCVSAASGKLLWKFNGAPSGRKALGHDRLISFWPVSGGPVLDQGRIFFGTGIWPIQTVYVHALDAATGKAIWSMDFGDGAAPERRAIGTTIQGYLRVVDGVLHVPNNLLLDPATGASRMPVKKYFDAEIAFVDGKVLAPEMKNTNPTAKFKTKPPDMSVTPELVADGKRFTTSRTGLIACSGPGKAAFQKHTYAPQELRAAADGWSAKADALLNAVGTREGYCLAVGAGTGRLIEELARQPKLRVIVLETDPTKAQALRRRWDAAGLYGQKIHLLTQDLSAAELPVCVFNLAIAEAPQELKAGPAFVTALFHALRPYGGAFCAEFAEPQHEALAGQVKQAHLTGAEVKRSGGWTLLRRAGALPGAGQWSHPHGDAGNTQLSTDTLVRAPLGVQWFGGEAAGLEYSNKGSQSHSPLIAGGRMIFQGPKLLFAVDVFTGRVLWKAGRAGPGAAFSWFPIVALEDQIYLAERTQVLCLDPLTGQTLRALKLPNGSAPEEFIADIRCAGGRLFALTPRAVAAWNCQDGALLWRQPVDANVLSRTGWNGAVNRNGLFAAGMDRIFVITGISPNVSPKEYGAIGRTAMEVPAAGTPLAILALDAANGKTAWTQPFERGFLSLQYSAAQDVLLQTPSSSGSHNRGLDPSGEKVVAWRGADGKELWSMKPETGPFLLHGDRFFTQEARAYDLQTGALKETLAFKRGTCSHAVGSPNLFVFSDKGGTAAFFDLLAMREGNFHSFRPGCRNALTAGDGVLVAPMYANGCCCPYPIWTALAFIHMPYPVQAPGR